MIIAFEIITLVVETFKCMHKTSQLGRKRKQSPLNFQFYLLVCPTDEQWVIQGRGEVGCKVVKGCLYYLYCNKT